MSSIARAIKGQTWRTGMALAMTAMLLGTAQADRLAFEGTTPVTDNLGTCADPVFVPGRGSDLLIYWSAIKGPLYYFSIVFGTRGSRWHVVRDGMPPGTYRVTVYCKKLTPRTAASCAVVDSISTRP